MNTNKTAAIILAAGQGTRIKAKNKNKVAFKLCGRPIIVYAVETLRRAGIDKVIVVVKFAEESVRASLGDSVIYARQGEKKGTGAAVADGMEAIQEDAENVIVMYGDDSAFYTSEVIEFLLRKHRKSNVEVTLLSLKLDQPVGLGRIIRSAKGNITDIVEEKVATPEQKLIKEINAGCYCFKLDFLKRRVSEIKENPISHEYYLTDIVKVALSHGEKVNVCLYSDSSIWFGVNSRSEWAKARLLKQKVNGI